MTGSNNNSTGSVAAWPPPTAHRIVTSSSDAARPVSTSGVDVRTGHSTPIHGQTAINNNNNVASFSGVGGWARTPNTPPDPKHNDEHKRLFMDEGKGLRVVIGASDSNAYDNNNNAAATAQLQPPQSEAEIQRAAAALLLTRAVSKHVVRDIDNPEVLVGGQDHVISPRCHSLSALISLLIVYARSFCSWFTES